MVSALRMPRRMQVRGPGSARLHSAALLSALLALAGQFAVRAADHHAHDLSIEHPWSRPTPPATTVGAVYFSVENRGPKADRLLHISSPVAAKVEIHETRLQQGSMEMRAVDGVDCPPGVTVRIEPGGLHVMLVGLVQPLVAGTRFPLTLRFRDAGVIDVQVRVANPD